MEDLGLSSAFGARDDDQAPGGIVDSAEIRHARTNACTGERIQQGVDIPVSSPCRFAPGARVVRVGVRALNPCKGAKGAHETVNNHRLKGREAARADRSRGGVPTESRVKKRV